MKLKVNIWSVETDERGSVSMKIKMAIRFGNWIVTGELSLEWVKGRFS